jgi:glycosyltransferase involved in cell wall biosynthesis
MGGGDSLHPTYSLVVPTWNEAPWLPRLLRATKRSGLGSRLSIVVADADSTDATREIALDHGCVVVRGGRPAVGRNRGASHNSDAEIVVFADADAIPQIACWERMDQLFSDPSVVGVHFPLVPIAGNPFVRGCYRMMRLYFTILPPRRYAQGVGTFIAARREAFTLIGGFRTDVAVGEDADFVGRLSRVGQVRFDKRARVWVSARRFYLEKPSIFALKTLAWAALRAMRLTYSPFGYRWEPYPCHIWVQEQARLAQLQIPELTDHSSE